jgi:D-alanine-D-alanine ligase
MRIGVLRGGVSPEYDISIRSGGRVLSVLQDSNITPVDMLVTKDGTFHVQGVEKDIEQIPEMVDMVFIALHGKLAEDGKVQKILETLNVPFNGTGSNAIARTHNKLETKAVAKGLGLKVPDAYVLRGSALVHESMREGYAKESALDVWSHIAPPWVVKPVSGGSSKYARYAGTFPELVNAIFEVLSSGDDVLVETFVPGREIHIFVSEGFRNQPLYVSPPLEIFHGSKILEEGSRAVGAYSSAVARDANPYFSKDIESVAKTLYQSLSLRGSVTMDFLVTTKGIVLLEVDALPALDEHSPLSRILEEIGAPLSSYIENEFSGK